MKKIMKGIVFLSLLSIFTNTTLPVFVSTVKAVEIGRVHSYILQQVRNGAGQVIVPQSGPFTCPGVVIDHSGRCQ